VGRRQEVWGREIPETVFATLPPPPPPPNFTDADGGGLAGVGALGGGGDARGDAGAGDDGAPEDKGTGASGFTGRGGAGEEGRDCAGGIHDHFLREWFTKKRRPERLSNSRAHPGGNGVSGSAPPACGGVGCLGCRTLGLRRGPPPDPVDVLEPERCGCGSLDDGEARPSPESLACSPDDIVVWRGSPADRTLRESLLITRPA